MNTRNINVQLLVQLHKQIAAEAIETGFIAINAHWIHISNDAMTQVAPLESWTLNIPRSSEIYPFEHNITIDGVQFLTISATPITPEGAQI